MNGDREVGREGRYVVQSHTVACSITHCLHPYWARCHDYVLEHGRKSGPIPWMISTSVSCTRPASSP